MSDGGKDVAIWSDDRNLRINVCGSRLYPYRRSILAYICPQAGHLENERYGWTTRNLYSRCDLRILHNDRAILGLACAIHDPNWNGTGRTLPERRTRNHLCVQAAKQIDRDLIHGGGTCSARINKRDRPRSRPISTK